MRQVRQRNCDLPPDAGNAPRKEENAPLGQKRKHAPSCDGVEEGLRSLEKGEGETKDRPSASGSLELQVRSHAAALRAQFRAQWPGKVQGAIDANRALIRRIAAPRQAARAAALQSWRQQVLWDNSRHPSQRGMSVGGGPPLPTFEHGYAAATEAASHETSGRLSGGEAIVAAMKVIALATIAAAAAARAAGTEVGDDEGAASAAGTSEVGQRKEAKGAAAALPVQSGVSAPPNAAATAITTAETGKEGDEVSVACKDGGGSGGGDGMNGATTAAPSFRGNEEQMAMQGVTPVSTSATLASAPPVTVVPVPAPASAALVTARVAAAAAAAAEQPAGWSFSDPEERRGAIMRARFAAVPRSRRRPKWAGSRDGDDADIVDIDVRSGFRTERVVELEVPVTVLPREECRPKNVTWGAIDASFPVADQPVLQYKQWFGDDDEEDIYNDVFNAEVAGENKAGLDDELHRWVTTEIVRTYGRGKEVRLALASVLGIWLAKVEAATGPAAAAAAAAANGAAHGWHQPAAVAEAVQLTSAPEVPEASLAAGGGGSSNGCTGVPLGGAGATAAGDANDERGAPCNGKAAAPVGGDANPTTTDLLLPPPALLSRCRSLSSSVTLSPRSDRGSRRKQRRMESFGVADDGSGGASGGVSGAPLSLGDLCPLSHMRRPPRIGRSPGNARTPHCAGRSLVVGGSLLHGGSGGGCSSRHGGEGDEDGFATAQSPCLPTPTKSKAASRAAGAVVGGSGGSGGRSNISGVSIGVAAGNTAYGADAGSGSSSQMQDCDAFDGINALDRGSGSRIMPVGLQMQRTEFRDPAFVAETYSSASDTYRRLFCRRCFWYDCKMHPNEPIAPLGHRTGCALLRQQAATKGGAAPTLAAAVAAAVARAATARPAAAGIGVETAAASTAATAPAATVPTAVGADAIGAPGASAVLASQAIESWAEREAAPSEIDGAKTTKLEGRGTGSTEDIRMTCGGRGSGGGGGGSTAANASRARGDGAVVGALRLPGLGLLQRAFLVMGGDAVKVANVLGIEVLAAEELYKAHNVAEYVDAQHAAAAEAEAEAMARRQRKRPAGFRRGTGTGRGTVLSYTVCGHAGPCKKRRKPMVSTDQLNCPAVKAAPTAAAGAQAAAAAAGQAANHDAATTMALTAPAVVEEDAAAATVAPTAVAAASHDQAAAGEAAAETTAKMEEHAGDGEDFCDCREQNHSCGKHCACREDCPNRFVGCKCSKLACNTKACACFAAGRECDPDLCRVCGACTEEGLAPMRQICRNDNVTMRRNQQLLLAPSQVKDAGWGMYVKHAVKKGQFLKEYTGEQISQDEAERRGRFYDKINSSYLFNLGPDTALDSYRKGNKSRFLNHSRRGNCHACLMVVNGDCRIAIFASEDLAPQEELFFDYRLDKNETRGGAWDTVVKSGVVPEWMVTSSMAHNISKQLPYKTVTVAETANKSGRLKKSSAKNS